jgi:hypothetical protein
MRVNPFVAPIVIIAALFGTVFTAQALGVWSVSGRTAINPDSLTPADLKGWMTLQQVMDGLKISQSDLFAIGGIPADTPPSMALKDLETVVSVTTLRERLAAKMTGAATPSSAAPTKAAPEVAVTPAAVHATPTPLAASQILPADQIKGRMSLKEVSEQCGVPLDKIIGGLQLAPNTDPNISIKDLVSQGKLVEVTDVQKLVASLQAK